MRHETYDLLKQFIDKYPGGVVWNRLKKHCEVVDKHLNPNEKVEFVFAGQLDNDNWSFFNTGVVAVTNQRLIVAQNRFLIPGYTFTSITPDLYNDLEVEARLFWGLATIDTIKEKVYVSNLPKSGLMEIETKITMFMQEAKKAYAKREKED